MISSSVKAGRSSASKNALVIFSSAALPIRIFSPIYDKSGISEDTAVILLVFSQGTVTAAETVTG